MRKLLTILVISLVVASTFIVFMTILMSLTDLVAWKGLVNFLLLVPSLIVAVCYEMGVIIIIRKFYPDVDPHCTIK